ncbi:MAG: hypothetical protein PHW60_09605 [Kiritimatiellae bacterium]|nr:hypothetical protein [Kiritimatiellia bacterium]
MKPGALFILQACALAVFLGGILAAIVTIRQNVLLREKIRNKTETLSRLAAIKQARDQHQAAVHVFESLSNAAPAALASLSRAAVTNATPEIREREARNLTAGWTLRQMEVVFSEVDLNQIPGFLLAAEQERPPWRLVECTLASSRKADGLGRAALIMEAVGKGGQQPARRSLPTYGGAEGNPGRGEVGPTDGGGWNGRQTPEPDAGR